MPDEYRFRVEGEAVPEVSRVIDPVVGRATGPSGVSFGAYTPLAVAARDSRVQATVSILGSLDWTPRDGYVTDELRWLMVEDEVGRVSHRALPARSRGGRT